MQKPLAPVAIPNPTLGASVLLLTHQSTTVNNIGTHMNKRQNWANLFLKIDDPSWDCSSIAICSPPNLLVLRCLVWHRQSSALQGCRSKHHSNVRPAIPKLVTWFRHMTLLLPTPHIRPLLFTTSGLKRLTQKRTCTCLPPRRLNPTGGSRILFPTMRKYLKMLIIFDGSYH
jgi:hypothetical protein